jgi:hypothetical protein
MNPPACPLPSSSRRAASAPRRAAPAFQDYEGAGRFAEEIAMRRRWIQRALGIEQKLGVL